jgi:hypothetical protein
VAPSDKAKELNNRTRAQLNGGVLRILAVGEREDMLAIERYLHENLPLGPEDAQSYYFRNR